MSILYSIGIFLIVVIIYILIEKLIRKILDVHSPEEEKSPKWYSGLLSTGCLIMGLAFFIYLRDDPVQFLFTTIVALLLYITLLQLIFYRGTREYLVTLVTGAIFIIIFSIGVEIYHNLS